MTARRPGTAPLLLYLCRVSNPGLRFPGYTRVRVRCLHPYIRVSAPMLSGEPVGTTTYLRGSTTYCRCIGSNSTNQVEELQSAHTQRVFRSSVNVQPRRKLLLIFHVSRCWHGYVSRISCCWPLEPFSAIFQNLFIKPRPCVRELRTHVHCPTFIAQELVSPCTLFGRERKRL